MLNNKCASSKKKTIFGLSRSPTSGILLNKSVNNAPNTTQWDYEGYLGFSDPTQPINQDSSLRLQLENGIWVIDNQDTYNFVRGTVLLYDIDARAADDIQ